MSKSTFIWRKQILKFLVCFLFVACFSQSIYGLSYVAGGEIYYKYNGGTDYTVYLEYYYSCTGIFPKIVTIAATDGITTKDYSDTACCTTYYSSGISSSQCTQCINGPSCTWPYGIKFVEFHFDMDVSAFKGCQLTLSWGASALSSDITTGGANENLYISTILNRCNGDHSSPEFQEQAAMMVTKGKLTDLYQSVIPANNSDSIYYHLVTTLLAAYTSIGYYPSNNYAYNHPLIYSGSALSDPKPKGFHYDPTSGELYFTPEKSDWSLISLEADEYSKDSSGKWYLAGSTVRTNQIICDTFNTTNNKPVFAETGGIGIGDTIIACAGIPISFRIEAYDQTNGYDSLSLSAVNETGGSVSFSPGNSPSASFSWTPANSDVSAKPYHVILTVTDNAAPISDVIQGAVYILVKDSVPDIHLAVSDSGCGTYHFNAGAGTPKGLDFQWFADGKSISSDTATTYTFPDNGTHVANLRVTNAAGCTYGYYDTLHITILPDVKTSGPKQICMGGLATLGATGGLSYNWYHTGGLSTDTGATVTVKPKTMARYYVSGTDSKGCRAVDTVVVSIDTVGLQLDTNAAICAGQMAYIKANINKAKSFSWVNLNGTQMSDSQELYFKLVSDTQYLLTVTDSFGCIKTVSGAAHIDSAKISTGSGVSVCYGDSVQLQASGGSNYTWVAELGLPNGSTKATPYVRPPFDLGYPVSFTDKYGCIANDTVEVVVSSLAHIGVSSSVTLCQGDSAQLSAFGGKSYIWSPAYNINNANKGNPWVHPDTTTTYYVTICDTFCGCKKKDSVLVKVNPSPIISAGTDQQICPEHTATIGTASQPGFVYSWRSLPAGYHSSLSSNTVSPSVATTYILSATKQVTGCKGIDSVSISVSTVVSPHFNGTQTVCQQDTSAYLVSPYNSANTYTWKIFGGHAIATAKNNVIVGWDSVGKDSLTLLEQTANQCKDSASLTVVSSAHPSVHISVVKNICLGSPTAFVDSGSAAGSYHWDFGNGDSSNLKSPAYTYPAIGLYEVSLAVANGQCGSSDMDSVHVYPLPIRSPVVSHTGYRQYLFDNSDSIGISYTWDLGDGSTFNYSRTSHTYYDTGIYNVVFGYSYPWGCAANFDTTLNVTDTITITPPPPHYTDTVYVVPNPFIDHINVNFSHSSNESVHIAIFDAIGQLVSQKNMDNQAPGNYSFMFQGWQISNGIYFLKFQAGSKVKVFKVIKI